MKKIFIIMVITFISLLSTPIFANLEELEDPGDDPDAIAAPIDSYVWVLAIVGLIYVLIRLRAFYTQGSTTIK
jgi:hypothetical protein